MPDANITPATVSTPNSNPAERNRRQAAVNYARASSRLEGATLSPEHDVINTRYINGDITSEERTKAVLALYRR